MIRAVGIDLDNTLYDHMQYVRGACRDVAEVASRSIGIDADRFFRRTVEQWQRQGSGQPTIFSQTLEEFDAYTQELEQLLVDTYRSHAPQLTPFSGALQSLKALRESGLKLGLLTDGQVPVQRRKLASLGLLHWFDAIVITGALGRAYYKPHPEGYRRLAVALDVSPGEMVYVGDRPEVDFLGAKELGVVTVRVLTGEYSNVAHAPEHVDHAAPSIEGATSWILSRRGGGSA